MSKHKHLNGWAIWTIGFCILLLTFIVITTATLVRQALLGSSRLSDTQRSIILSIAEFPSLLKKLRIHTAI